MHRHSRSIPLVALFICLLPALAAAQELRCGETLRRTIEQKFDFVSFAAKAGEVVSITVAAVLTDPAQDPNFVPEFQIEDPDGDPVFLTVGDRERLCPSIVHQCETMELDLDGIYTIIVNDNGKKQKGTYAITLEAVSQTANGEWNGPPNALAPAAPACKRTSQSGKADGTQVIAFDAPVGGVIEDQGETDTFTFDGKTGQTVVVELSLLTSAGGSFKPRAKVFDPSGQPVEGDCLLSEACTRGPFPVDGAYTIKVFEEDYANTGDYTLLLRDPDAPTTTTTTTTTTIEPPPPTTTTTTLVPTDEAPLYDLSRTLRRTGGLTPPEELGAAIAVEGGTLLIGTPFDQTKGLNSGAAYVVDIASTPLDPAYGTLRGSLFKPGGSSVEDRFGAAVALLGGVPVVGAPGADVTWPAGPVADAGAVYVFAADGSSSQVLIQPEPVAGSDFGAALAVLGQELFVGAPGEGGFGRLFLFFPSGSKDAQDDFVASDWAQTPQSGDRFGFAIAAQGDFLAIGAPGEPSRGGRVFLLNRATNARHVLSSPSAMADDRFGSALTFVDGTLVIGAPGAGKVFKVQDLNQPVVVELAAVAGSELGASLAPFAGDVLVGAPAGGLTAGGRVLRLDLDNGLTATTYEKAEPESGDGYGAAVAAIGNQVFIGVPGDDSGNIDAGAVYAYRGIGITSEEAIFRKRVVDAQFGASIAADDELISVGAPTDVGGEGAVYIFDAQPTCTPNCPSLKQFAGPTVGSRFGQAVAIVDGVTVVGAPTDGDVGAAYLVQLGTDTRATIPNPETPPLAGDQFGLSAASADGEILVGAPLLGTTDTGAVFVFQRGSLNRHLTLRNPVPTTGDFFGAAIAAEGDTIAVGAPFDSTDAAKAGAVYLFQRETGESLQGKPLVSPTPRERELFGAAVAISPKYIVVGAPGEDQDQLGRVHVFNRQSRTLLRTIDNADGASPGDRFGTAVAIVDDRVLVGAPFAGAAPAIETGAAYLFDPDTGQRLQVFGNPSQRAFDHFGLSLAAGPTGPIIGAPTPGRVFVYVPAAPPSLTVRNALVETAAAAAPVCGNGIPERGEECDDGNTIDTDDCRNDCTTLCCVIDPLAADRCNDFDPCTDDSVDVATGKCVNTANGTCCTTDASCAGQDDVCRLCAGCSLFPWDCCDQGATCLLSSPECTDLDCFERPVCECQGGLTCDGGPEKLPDAMTDPFRVACEALSRGSNVQSADNPLGEARMLNKEARQALKAARRATKQAFRSEEFTKSCRKQYLGTINRVKASIRSGNKLRRCVKELTTTE